MQKIGFVLLLLGAGGMDNPDMTAPAVMVFMGIVIIAVSAWRERRKGQYDAAGIKSKRHSGNVPGIRKQSISNNKAA